MSLKFTDDNKKALLSDSTYKNIVISFPYDEDIADITNDNIIEESFSFEESLSSQNKFKFGCAEASSVEFKCFGVDNIKGKIIDVEVEVFYNTTHTNNFTFPLGRFIIESCEFDNTRIIRNVRAYSSNVDLSKNVSSLEAAKRLAALTYPTRFTGQLYSFDILKYLVAELNISEEEFMNNIGIRDHYWGDVIENNGWGADSPYIKGNINHGFPSFNAVIRYKFTEITDTNRFHLLYRINKIDEIHSKLNSIINNKKIKQRLKDKCWEITKSKYPSRDRFENYFESFWLSINVKTWIYDTTATYTDTPMLNNAIWIYPYLNLNSTYSKRVKMEVRVPYQVVIDNETITILDQDILNDLALIAYGYNDNDLYPDLLFPGNVPHFLGYKLNIPPLSYSCPIVNIYDIDAQSIAEGYTELGALFVTVGRNGNNRISRMIGFSDGLYPSEDRFPSEDLYPEDPSGGIIFKNQYLEYGFTYDEEKTKPYDSVSVTWEDSNGVTHFKAYQFIKDISEKPDEDTIINNLHLSSGSIPVIPIMNSITNLDSGDELMMVADTKPNWAVTLDVMEYVSDYNKDNYQTYELGWNYLIQNMTFTEYEIDVFLYNVASALLGFTYTPASLESLFMPWLEPGDKILVEVDGDYIPTVVLRRSMSGITFMKDSIEAR